MEKLNMVYDLTYDGKFVRVELSDGRVITCKADCFGETEDEVTGKAIPDLRVIKQDKTSEIIDESDIVSIKALTE
jgi:hypothetical protein